MPDKPLPHWQDRLVMDLNISEDSPVVKGTWVTVSQIVSQLLYGYTWADITKSHPELTEEDIRICLSYAASQDMEPDEPTLDELVDKAIETFELYNFEGDRGIESLITLVGMLGYSQTGVSHYSPITNFLLDNPGAVVALVEWIKEQNVSEWKEHLTTAIRDAEEEKRLETEESQDNEQERDADYPD